MYYLNYICDLGKLTILYDDDGISKLFLPYDEVESLDEAVYKEDENIRSYFDNYFKGIENEPLKLNINATDFQKKVYDVLLNTSRGTLITYGGIAEIIGCGSAQAIGQALKRNKIPLLIPCHRVVGKNWDGGFGGETTGEKMEFKKFLLKLEKNMI